jgi:hypothetical protein
MKKLTIYLLTWSLLLNHHLVMGVEAAPPSLSEDEVKANKQRLETLKSDLQAGFYVDNVVTSQWDFLVFLTFYYNFAIYFPTKFWNVPSAIAAPISAGFFFNTKIEKGRQEAGLHELWLKKINSLPDSTTGSETNAGTPTPTPTATATATATPTPNTNKNGQVNAMLKLFCFNYESSRLYGSQHDGFERAYDVMIGASVSAGLEIILYFGFFLTIQFLKSPLVPSNFIERLAQLKFNKSQNFNETIFDSGKNYFAILKTLEFIFSPAWAAEATATPTDTTAPPNEVEAFAKKYCPEITYVAEARSIPAANLAAISAGVHANTKVNYGPIFETQNLNRWKAIGCEEIKNTSYTNLPKSSIKIKYKSSELDFANKPLHVHGDATELKQDLIKPLLNSYSPSLDTSGLEEEFLKSVRTCAGACRLAVFEPIGREVLFSLTAQFMNYEMDENADAANVFQSRLAAYVNSIKSLCNLPPTRDLNSTCPTGSCNNRLTSENRARLRSLYTLNGGGLRSKVDRKRPQIIRDFAGLDFDLETQKTMDSMSEMLQVNHDGTLSYADGTNPDSNNFAAKGLKFLEDNRESIDTAVYTDNDGKVHSKTSALQNIEDTMKKIKPSKKAQEIIKNNFTSNQTSMEISDPEVKKMVEEIEKKSSPQVLKTSTSGTSQETKKFTPSWLSEDNEDTNQIVSPVAGPIPEASDKKTTQSPILEDDVDLFEVLSLRYLKSFLPRFSKKK